MPFTLVPSAIGGRLEDGSEGRRTVPLVEPVRQLCKRSTDHTGDNNPVEIVGFLPSDFSQKILVAGTDTTGISSHIRQEPLSVWLIGERSPLERILEHVNVCFIEQAGFVAEREVVRPQNVRMRQATR